MILAGAPLLSIAVTVFFVNLRNFLMCLHDDHFQGNSLGSNILIGSFVTDESYAVLLRKHIEDKQIAPSWMYGNNFWLRFLGHFTTLGNLIGGLIPNPEQFGLDFLGCHVCRHFLWSVGGYGSDHSFEENRPDFAGGWSGLCRSVCAGVVLCGGASGDALGLCCGVMIDDKTSILLIILAAALVTWVPRVLPFVLTQNKSLPPAWSSSSAFCPSPLSLP